jgi:hypothetical protein
MPIEVRLIGRRRMLVADRGTQRVRFAVPVMPRALSLAGASLVGAANASAYPPPRSPGSSSSSSGRPTRRRTLTITDVTFGGFSAPWGGLYGRFSLGTSGVTGAFTGGDNGATSSNISATSQDIGEIVAECQSPTGLKKINTGLGQIKLQ